MSTVTLKSGYTVSDDLYYTTIGALQQASQDTLQVLFDWVNLSRQQFIQKTKDSFPYQLSRLPFHSLLHGYLLPSTDYTPHCRANEELQERKLFLQDRNLQNLIYKIAQSSLKRTPQGTIQVVMQLASQKANPSPKNLPLSRGHYQYRSSHDHHIPGKNHRDHASR